jgi:hypothetical protein
VEDNSRLVPGAARHAVTRGHHVCSHSHQGTTRCPRHCIASRPTLPFSQVRRRKHSAAGASSALRSREDESSPGALTGKAFRVREHRPRSPSSHGGRRLRGGTAPDGAHNPVLAGSTPAPAIHRHTSHPDPHERCCRPAFGSAAAFSGVPADREVCSGRADDSSALPTQTPFVPAYRLLASAPGFFARASSLLPAVARSLGRWFDAFVRAAGRRRRRSAVSAKPSTPTSTTPTNLTMRRFRRLGDCRVPTARSPAGGPAFRASELPVRSDVFPLPVPSCSEARRGIQPDVGTVPSSSRNPLSGMATQPQDAGCRSVARRSVVLIT